MSTSKTRTVKCPICRTPFDPAKYPNSTHCAEPEPKRREYVCAAGCGYPVAGPRMICGECACEDDGAIW